VHAAGDARCGGCLEQPTHQLAAHRVAADHGLARLEEPPRAVERHEHAAHDAPEDLVGQPGDRVLLADRRRDAAQARHQHHRPRGIAAHPDHGVGREPANDPPRLPQRARQPQEPAHRAERADGLEARDLDQVELPSQLRQHAGLEPSPCADEADLRVGHSRAQLLGERDAGEDMAAGSAAGDQQAHDPACEPK
jgi:hypothetical protein